MGELVDLSKRNRRHSIDRVSANIQYFSHSTVLITSGSGQKIIIDPWLEGCPTTPENLKTIDKLDAIVLTHGHTDHTASAVGLANSTGAQIFAIYELANLIKADGVDESQIIPMGKGGAAPLGESGVNIYLTNAFHSSSYVCADGETRYAGEACGVVVELEDERAIYHAGDTCLFSDMKLIGEKFRPDVALLPIGDRFTMNPAEAALAAKLIEPAITIPIHYGTFDALTGTPDVFEKHLRGSEITVTTLEPGGVYSL